VGRKEDDEEFEFGLAMQVVVRLDQEGEVCVPLVNYTDEEITISEGCMIGGFQEYGDKEFTLMSLSEVSSMMVDEAMERIAKGDSQLEEEAVENPKQRTPGAQHDQTHPARRQRVGRADEFAETTVCEEADKFAETSSSRATCEGRDYSIAIGGNDASTSDDRRKAAGRETSGQRRHGIRSRDESRKPEGERKATPRLITEGETSTMTRKEETRPAMLLNS
jgi:hypothetical protein